MQKKLKLIYNPFSGDKGFKFNLDICLNIFQSAGYDVHIFRSSKRGDIDQHIKTMDKDYAVIVASGGDGTIHIVLNALMKYSFPDITLGIIPSGTANDLASFLGLKAGRTEEACQLIADTQPFAADIGIVNGQYFINVCAGGLFTNVSQTVNSDFKDVFGSLAYYMKGFEQLPNFCPIPMRITNSKEVIEDEFYFFLILNTSGAGGFDKLSPQSKLNDGIFEFIAIKAKPIYEIAVLFLKILKGDHIHDSNTVYFKDNKIKVEYLSDKFLDSATDVDGEAGPKLPISIEVLPKAIKLFGNNPI